MLRGSRAAGDRNGVEAWAGATLPAVRAAVAAWPESEVAARREARLFDDRLTGLALHRLSAVGLIDGGAPASV